MRSSKNRSRSKGNRNRSGQVGGNIVNRVFDSSGPEGKVRGTPQQIVEKYNQLTRDAQLSHDRVAAESFQQHAEHYLRMLAEAQREMDAKAAQQQANQQHNQQGGQQGGGNQGGGNQNNNGGQQGSQHGNQQGGGNQQGNPDTSGSGGGQGGNSGTQGGGNRRKRSPRGGDDQQPVAAEQPIVDQPVADQSAPAQPQTAEAQGSFDAVIEQPAGESGLVETPESTPKPKRTRTRRRKPDTPPDGGGDQPAQDTSD